MNKIILVTGATAGFGRAIAMRFAKNGYNIIITGRRKERLDELEKELLAYGNIRVLSLNFDVRKQAEVAMVIENLPEEWRSIDILPAGLIERISFRRDYTLRCWIPILGRRVWQPGRSYC